MGIEKTSIISKGNEVTLKVAQDSFQHLEAYDRPTT